MYTVVGVKIMSAPPTLSSRPSLPCLQARSWQQMPPEMRVASAEMEDLDRPWQLPRRSAFLTWLMLILTPSAAFLSTPSHGEAAAIPVSQTSPLSAHGAHFFHCPREFTPRVPSSPAFASFSCACAHSFFGSLSPAFSY